MLRAAELTKQNGFHYFAIVSEKDMSSIYNWTIEGTATTTGSIDRSGNFQARTTYDPPQTIPMLKPGTSLVVKTFNDKPSGGTAYDAEFLETSVKQKYKIK